MKKFTSISLVSIFSIFISLLLLAGCGHTPEPVPVPVCPTLSNTIDENLVKGYIDNYYSIVKADYHYALSQISLTKEESYCISTFTDKRLKLIVGSKTTDSTGKDFIAILEIERNGKYSFYDLDELFPTKKRGGNGSHLCPPPAGGCGIPFE